jgi:hypothetical protein
MQITNSPLMGEFSIIGMISESFPLTIRSNFLVRSLARTARLSPRFPKHSSEKHQAVWAFVENQRMGILRIHRNKSLARTFFVGRKAFKCEAVKRQIRQRESRDYR